MGDAAEFLRGRRGANPWLCGRLAPHRAMMEGRLPGQNNGSLKMSTSSLPCPCVAFHGKRGVANLMKD